MLEKKPEIMCTGFPDATKLIPNLVLTFCRWRPILVVLVMGRILQPGVAMCCCTVPVPACGGVA